MTATEMAYQFSVGFDSIANFSSPGYEEREISLFLTQAQQNIYADLVDPVTQPRSSANKEELGKIVLAELIRNTGKLTPYLTSSTSPMINLPNGQFVQLPVDFFFPLSESGEIEFLTTSYYYSFTTQFPLHISSNIYIRPITRLEYNSNIYSHIRKPDDDVIWRMEYGKYSSTTAIGVTYAGVVIPFNAGTGTATKLSLTQSSATVTFVKTDNSAGTIQRLIPVGTLVKILGVEYTVLSCTTAGMVLTVVYAGTTGYALFSGTTTGIVAYKNNPKVYELIGDGTYLITGYTSSYYRRLQDIVVPYGSVTTQDCELDNYIHPIIVRDAITIASAAIKDTQKYQLSASETQKQI
jgi:multidrug transporter EmrE-like cation transporter